MENLSDAQIKNLSSLLLSADDNNTLLGFELMKGLSFSEAFITELFVVWKLTSNSELQKQAEQELLRLDSQMEQVLALKQKLSRDRYTGANEKTIAKNIDYYVMCSKDKLNGIKLAKALVQKYGHGFQYLLDNLKGEELVAYLATFMEGKKLTFTQKGVSKIPKEIFEIPGIEELEELDMSGNKISSVPAQIGKLVNLKKLNLNSNVLKGINKNIVKCTQLQSLDIGDNKFKEFPTTICSCLNLEELYMVNSASYFSDVYILPEGFLALKKLRILYLHRERKEHIPNLYEIISACKGLEELNLSEYTEPAHKIAELQKELPTCNIVVTKMLTGLNYN